MFHRDKFTCQYCGDDAYEIDHVIPFSNGGSNDLSNLVAACRFCNASVNARVFDSFEAKKEFLDGLHEARVRRKKRKLSICADCGIVFEYRKDGSSRVLCGSCYAIDDNDEGHIYASRQARLKELNKGLISEERVAYQT